MTDWHASALCAQVDVELFFPEPGGTTAAARKTCWNCPVRLECLTEGLAEGDTWGIRAGLLMSEQHEDHRLVRKGASPATVATNTLRRINEQARNGSAVRTRGGRPNSRHAVVHAA